MLYTRVYRFKKVMRPIWRRHYDKAPFPQRWDYPREALREAIMNAIVHRDYTDPGNIQVCIFDDRLEIYSPELLPNGLFYGHNWIFHLSSCIIPGHYTAGNAVEKCSLLRRNLGGKTIG